MSDPVQHVDALAKVLWIWSVVVFCIAGILQLLNAPRLIRYVVAIAAALLGLGLLRQAWIALL